MGSNVKTGYAYSVALHILIAIAMFAWTLLDVLFPKEEIENKVVFDMVEPTVNPPAPPSQVVQPDVPKIDVPKKIDDIKPIDISPPDNPLPDNPPSDNPLPDNPPKDYIVPSKKEIEKPKEQTPKKVSFYDWKKKNKTKATNSPNSASPKRVPVKIVPIIAKHVSTDSIANISDVSSNVSTAMRNALTEYTNIIYITAKRNWKKPSDTLTARVSFRVSKNGIISNIRIVNSSGDKDFDNSIIQIFKIITIPPPPDNKPHNINITFRGI